MRIRNYLIIFFFSLLLYFSFKLIIFYKSIYLLIYTASLLVCSFILILKLKKIKNKIYILLQYLVIIFFAFNYHQVFINKFSFDWSILKKEKTNLENLEGFTDANKKTIIEEQAHLINDPMPEKVTPKIWTTLKCFSLHHLYCQRFNNLFF